MVISTLRPRMSQYFEWAKLMFTNSQQIDLVASKLAETSDFVSFSGEWMRDREGC